MENKANKNTEVKYISAEQAADIYKKIEVYISEELNNLERMLLEEINQTLQNWLNSDDIQHYLDLLDEVPLEMPDPNIDLVNPKVYFDNESDHSVDV